MFKKRRKKSYVIQLGGSLMNAVCKGVCGGSRSSFVLRRQPSGSTLQRISSVIYVHRHLFFFYKKDMVQMKQLAYAVIPTSVPPSIYHNLVYF